jgi:DNA primase
LAVRPGDRRCLAHDYPSIDIDSALKQAMILHRRAITLHKEMMDAERALAENDSESNLAVIRDLQLQLSALDGMEADRDRLNTGTGAGSDQGLATA